MNECLEDKNSCNATNMICIDTLTSYRCDCVDGMKLADGVCTGIKFNAS